MNTQIRKLDIGCGNRKRPGFLGLDILPHSQADVIHDLSLFPYPFDDSTFEVIYADNVIEHLEAPIPIMEELHRISSPNGKVIIIVPYFRSHYAFIDPTHRSFFGVNTFSYLDPSHHNCLQYGYSTARFAVEQRLFNEGLTMRGPLKFPISIITRLANRFPAHYEAYLSHLFPLDQLSFHLRTIKDS